jgi:hypothetical protein
MSRQPGFNPQSGHLIRLNICNIKPHEAYHSLKQELWQPNRSLSVRSKHIINKDKWGIVIMMMGTKTDRSKHVNMNGKYREE